MKRLLSLIIAASIIYTIADKKLKDIGRYDAVAKVDTKVVDSNMEEAHPNSTTEEKKESIGGKIISTVVTNALQTEQGQELFEKIIKPHPLNTGDSAYIIQQYDIIGQLFKIKTYGDVSEIGPVSCGHSVHARYKIYGAADSIIEEEGTKTFVVGLGGVMFGLENVVIGMYKGQTREAIIPAEFVSSGHMPSKLPQKIYKIEVTVLEILPQTFIKPSEVKEFDNVIAGGSPYLCGVTATFDMKISKLNGEVIYDSVAKKQKVSMRLGDNLYPFIISYSLFQKIPEGKRTVLAPGKYLRALGNKNNNQLLGDKIPKDDEFFLIDFFNFEKMPR